MQPYIHADEFALHAKTFAKMPPPDDDAFWHWFDDSKVLRKTSSVPKTAATRPNDPLIVYHGTRSKKLFSAFLTEKKLPKRGGYGFMKERSNDPNVFYGPHFTDDAEIALDFATGAYGWIEKEESDVPRVYPVYLSIQNPVAYESESEMHYDIANLALASGYRLPRAFVDEYLMPEVLSRSLPLTWETTVSTPATFRRLMREDEDFRGLMYEASIDVFQEHRIVEYMIKMVRKAKERLIELGYDGIWYTNEGEGGNGWVAFKANQIKSAIANDGTYGPSKDIRRNPCRN